MQYFYCYSPLLMHYLKACNIAYECEGFNEKTHSPFFKFKRDKKLDMALSGWENFKLMQMRNIENYAEQSDTNS